MKLIIISVRFCHLRLILTMKLITAKVGTRSELPQRLTLMMSRKATLTGVVNRLMISKNIAQQTKSNSRFSLNKLVQCNKLFRNYEFIPPSSTTSSLLHLQLHHKWQNRGITAKEARLRRDMNPSAWLSFCYLGFPAIDQQSKIRNACLK